MRAKIRQKKLTSALILILLSLMVALPLYWAVTISFRPMADLFMRRITPSSLTIKNYEGIIFGRDWAGFQGVSFLIPLRNSLIIALGVTAIGLIISPLAAYALAMIPLRGKELISSYLLLAYVFPPFVLIIALSRFIHQLGLMDTFAGVMLLHLIIVVPYCTWMLRGYFLSVPKELEEAALVDGCSRIGALLRIILPVSAPGFVTAAIFSFTLSWQDMLFALITIDSHSKFTLPMALLAMVLGDYIQWGKLMAGAIIAILLPSILYLVMQRYVVQGLTGGAVKG